MAKCAASKKDALGRRPETLARRAARRAARRQRRKK